MKIHNTLSHAPIQLVTILTWFSEPLVPMFSFICHQEKARCVTVIIRFTEKLMKMSNCDTRTKYWNFPMNKC